MSALGGQGWGQAGARVPSGTLLGRDPVRPVRRRRRGPGVPAGSTELGPGVGGVCAEGCPGAGCAGLRHDPEAPVGGRPGARRCWGSPLLPPPGKHVSVGGEKDFLRGRRPVLLRPARRGPARPRQASGRGLGSGTDQALTVRSRYAKDPAETRLRPPPCARPPPSALQRERPSRRRKGRGLGQAPWSAASKTLPLAKSPPIEPPVTPVLGPRRSGCRVSCLSGPVFIQAEGLGDGRRTRRVLVATSPCWKTPGTSQSPPPSGAPAAHPLCRAVPAAPPAVDRRSPPWHVQRPRGLEVALDTLTPSAAQGTIWWAANCVKSHPSGPRVPDTVSRAL